MVPSLTRHARARRDAPDQNQIGSNRLPSDWTSGRSRGGSCARTGTRQYVRYRPVLPLPSASAGLREAHRAGMSDKTGGPKRGAIEPNMHMPRARHGHPRRRIFGQASRKPRPRDARGTTAHGKKQSGSCRKASGICRRRGARWNGSRRGCRLPRTEKTGLVGARVILVLVFSFARAWARAWPMRGVVVWDGRRHRPIPSAVPFEPDIILG